MNQEKYLLAKRKVRVFRKFYQHVITYVLVNLGLFLVNMLNLEEGLWFYYPLFGWGVGVLAHGLAVFSKYRLFDEDWEERKIRQTLEKMK